MVISTVKNRINQQKKQRELNPSVFFLFIAYYFQTSSDISIDDIIGFNNRHAERCLKHGQSLLIASNNTSGFLKEEEYLKKERN